MRCPIHRGILVPGKGGLHCLKCNYVIKTQDMRVFNKKNKRSEMEAKKKELKLKEPEFRNADDGLCVMCGKGSNLNKIYVCLKCNNICSADIQDILDIKKTMILADIKSSCCKSDIQVLAKITCSDKCHDDFVRFMEDKFGKYKKVTDIESGTTYKVPVKDIIEKGLTYGDLQVYPEWIDN